MIKRATLKEMKANVQIGLKQPHEIEIISYASLLALMFEHYKYIRKSILFDYLSYILFFLLGVLTMLSESYLWIFCLALCIVALFSLKKGYEISKTIENDIKNVYPDYIHTLQSLD